MLAPDDEAHGSPFSQQTHPPLVFVVWCFHHSLIDNNHSSSSIIHRLYRHDSTQTQQGAYQSFVNWFTTPNECQQQGGGWPSLFKICGSSTQQVTSLWFLSLTRYINRIRLVFSRDVDKADPMLIWSVILFWFWFGHHQHHCVAQLLFVSRCLALAIQAASLY